MTDQKVRVGIDVGGTNTKAVAINDTTYEIIGEGIVPTTHGNKHGVSQGVVDAFHTCLIDNNIDPEDVVFIAHSTTQATNALLEGDVAKVGVIGIATGGLVGWLSKIQANISDIELDSSGKRKIVSVYRYINEKEINDEIINEIIDDLINEGCEVIGVSRTFGVDDNRLEQRVKELGKEKGIEVTSASDISKLYGLTRRTRTAVINSSILPKMIDTANSTESAVKEAGIKAPLMIMRGDGGVMDVEEMRKRPVLTMLSGPAASTVGALMYLKVSNGIFIEVGGTSTDIGVIKNGRPMVDYAVVGGQRTMVSSMDVHVSGVAGGSMIRAEKGKLVHVGPRSCHIANLPYVSYSPLEELTNLKVVNVQPQEGDPDDYVALENGEGKQFALTTTDAATALGIIEEGDYSYGSREATLRGFEVFGEYIGMTAEEAATAVLDNAADTCIDVIEELAEKYNVERSQISLVGGGGGAKVLVPFIAKKMELRHSLADKAEVISSIGVALALVQDVVERVIPDPTQEDIIQIRTEAQDAAIQSGASPETVEVQIEIDTRTSKVRAIATGSTEASTKDLSTRVNEEEAKEIIADSMQADVADIELIAANDNFFVFGRQVNGQQEIRVIDNKGVVKRQREDGTAETTTPGGARSVAQGYWEELAVFKSDIKLYPDIYMCIGGQVIDYEGLTDANQLSLLMDTELSVRNPTEEVIIVGAKMTYNTQLNKSEASFEEKLIYLFSIDDYVYSLYSTYEDPISGKISDIDREEIIKTSIEVGRDLARKLLSKSPNKNVKDYIKDNDIELVIKDKKEVTKFVYFGTYESEGPITLYSGNISRAKELLEKENIDWFSNDAISDIVLAHELFHFYEDKYPDLYTNKKEIKLWKIGPFKHKSKLICPSEIAAMSFTKELLSLDFNPGAINYILYSSMNRKTGEAYFDKIEELNK